jgi:cell wall-associated NlpC family hydrolase
MNKFFISIAVLFMSSVCTSWAQIDEEVYVSADKEIDNYDFLYNNAEDFNYDVSAVEDLMREAMSHLGTPYRLGSKGPNRFDCSGFTSYVYKQQKNQNIGSCSREQYQRNVPVKRGDLQRGDLVFFTSPRSGKNVGHVGIVVEVDPVTNDFTFIHASTKEGVKISKSTESNYARRYIGARRVE